MGLTEAEAAARLAAFGPNELPEVGKRNLLRIARETLREPMFLLLLGAAALYLALGDLAEGLFLSASALAAIGLVIYQETRSEKALSALRQLARPYARVIRDGVPRRIPARDLVPGDACLVGEGERVPADGLAVEGEMVSVDESLLTGESAPVSKSLAREDEDFEPQTTPGAESGPFLFAGTLVVRGQTVMSARRTGVDSALGRIGSALARIVEEPTPLQKSTARLVWFLGLLALGFSLLLASVYGMLRDDWIGGALAGITVAIALIPEEFPMVLAVFLALGARRLAGQRVLARRGAAIEALGGTTTLCVDKTGTLTENRMTVARLFAAGGECDTLGGCTLDQASGQLLQIADLASAVRPIDPMDRAIRSFSRLADPERQRLGAAPERCWPLRPTLMAIVQSWQGPDGARITAAKGAPEAIYGLCRLPPAEVESLQAIVHSFAARGLRVLGVASARTDGPFPDEPLSVPFAFAGLVGFLDPVRPDVRGALNETRCAGIKVMMITGDHPATALAIAGACGIETSAGALLGPELAQMTVAELSARLGDVRIFARVLPEQKLLIVEALKANAEVVAMTGDGVNDAPALEAAHIGIAMGTRGTDVAREAADLILLDDGFGSIVAGIRLGRRIFANLRQALTYITAIHIPIAGLALAPVLLGLPPLLLPMHVVLLEFAVDPICALVFEGEPSEDDAMRQPPRRRDDALFGRRHILFALLQGGGILAGVAGLYLWALAAYPEPAARGAAFAALVLANLSLALANATGKGRLFAPHRRAFWAIAVAVLAVLAAITWIPSLGALFRIAPPDVPLFALTIAVAAVCGLWPATLKHLRSARAPEPGPQGPLRVRQRSAAAASTPP